MAENGKLSQLPVEMGIQPNGYVENGTDEDTGHSRKLFEGQSIHGDTVRAKYKFNNLP
jgi:hypothetical protein